MRKGDSGEESDKISVSKAEEAGIAGRGLRQEKKMAGEERAQFWITEASLGREAGDRCGNGQVSELGKGRTDMSPEVVKLKASYSFLDLEEGGMSKEEGYTDTKDMQRRLRLLQK